MDNDTEPTAHDLTIKSLHDCYHYACSCGEQSLTLHVGVTGAANEWGDHLREVFYVEGQKALARDIRRTLDDVELS
jgi:hypothetical protein